MFSFFQCKSLPDFVPVHEHMSDKIISNGIDRSFRYYIPKNKKEGQMPLIFVLHGGGSSGEGMIYLTRLSERAEKDGFIVVYPDGYANRWNDGRGVKHSITDQKNTNDVLFFKDMVQYFRKKYTIDEKRIHVVGLSNGGFMAQRLACEASEIFASGYSVAATTSRYVANNCNLTEPLSMGFIFGKKDDIIPFKGGTIYIPISQENQKDRIAAGESLSFMDSLQFWKEKLKCDLIQEKYIARLSSSLKRDILEYRYQSCDAKNKLQAHLIESGGHVWPHGFYYQSEKKYGYLSDDLDASSVILNFFKETGRRKGD
ncbi:poly(3-hydroxybutyrate) depolymerase [Leptospira idonii]|uniref:Poly(3-hydroxybutyrate) depolymerase n=2 Tax=Leptospira idonii TaxID=1193500 RepID=A0A4R9M3N7_9LEPT|nr:poly(3-hydroxybutyrate) depolymerase [Leptospira idonii]